MFEFKVAEMQVDYVDHLGSDINVVNAARVSFAKEVKEFDLEKDSKLINYLAKHNHFTPLAHTSVTIRVKAPIFMARQFVKHQIGLVWNEESRRYIDDEPEFYIPKEWRTRPKGSVKQGSGTESIPKPEYSHGFCINCGSELLIHVSGQPRKYCSTKCKSEFTNKHRNPYKTVFGNAKARVLREDKVGWDLDFETFEFPDYCKYLGLKLDYSYGKGAILPNSPSFDRIDPTKGYVNGNVEIISNRANSMKNDADIEQQVAMAKAVLLRHKGVVVDETLSVEGVCASSLNLYKTMVADGYAPEMARMVLPQNVMTNWMWTGSLVAFARVVKLRTDSHAQQEAQELGWLINDAIKDLYPVSWKALMDN